MDFVKTGLDDLGAKHTKRNKAILGWFILFTKSAGLYNTRIAPSWLNSKFPDFSLTLSFFPFSPTSLTVGTLHKQWCIRYDSWASRNYVMDYLSWYLSPFLLFVWFDSLRPINNLSVIKEQIFLGWTRTKLGLMFLLKDTTQWRQ